MEYNIIKKNAYRYITIPELTELGLKHAFTTMDMDIGMTTNKNIEEIKKNVKEVYDLLGIQPKLLYNGYQTHSANIAIVENLGQGLESPLGRYFPNTDGLVTNRDDVALIGPVTINDTAANVYLTMLINIGVFGLVSYLLFVLFQVIFGIKNINKYSSIFLLTIICYLTQDFFNISLVITTPIFYLLMGVHYISLNDYVK